MSKIIEPSSIDHNQEGMTYHGSAADLITYLWPTHKLRDYQIVTDAKAREAHLVYLPSGLLIAFRSLDSDCWTVVF